MAQKTVSTKVEKAVIDDVKDIIRNNLEDQLPDLSDSNYDQLKKDQERYVEDLATACVRAAQLVVLEHVDRHIEYIVEYRLTKSKVLSNLIGKKVAAMLGDPSFGPTFGVGPATAAPAAIAAFSTAQKAIFAGKTSADHAKAKANFQKIEKPI